MLLELTGEYSPAGRKLLVQEFGMDPLLRQWVRERIKRHAVISCIPTQKGKTKIDDMHMFYVRFLHGTKLNVYDS
jgi:transcriptional accessory protein Tex/SPT6